jgi:hypothetical protein
MSLAALSVEQLAQRCVEETDKFNRRQSNDPQFCFELLRRALAEGVAEGFTAAYHIYERQVLKWVHSHSGFAETGESADYFARSALSAFYFALRGPKFARFPALQQVLAYLKLCVHTAIAQYLRDQGPAEAPLMTTDEASVIPDLGTHADAAELWDHICGRLPDERDRLLARCAFVQDLRPRQIVELYPAHWSDEREVSVALYRIRRLLRGDADLRQRMGLPPDEPSRERGASSRQQ